MVPNRHMWQKTQTDLGIPQSLLYDLREFEGNDERSKECGILSNLHAMLVKDNSWISNANMCDKIKPIVG